MYCVFIDDDRVMDRRGNSVSLLDDALEISWYGKWLTIGARTTASGIEVHAPLSAKLATWRDTGKKLTSADLFNVLAMIDDCVPLLGRDVAFVRLESTHS